MGKTVTLGPTTALCRHTAVAVIGALLCASPAHADALPSPPHHAATLGPSVAWVSGAEHTSDGVMLGVDLAYFVERVWWSVGTRLRLEPDGLGAAYPYVEAGGWLLVNLGVGYSLGLESGRSAWHNAHVFLGVPIPLGTSGPILPYIEPYYRPMLGDGVVVHEVGVLLKGALVSERSYVRRRPPP